MHHRALTGLACAFVIAASLLTIACENENVVDVPTNPTLPTQITENFTGSIARNGASAHPFVAQQSGSVTAVLSSLTPDSSVQVGFALGTWNSGSACQVTIANDRATQGTVVTGTVTGNGSLCVRIYDSTGTLSNSAANYQIDVTHP
jgi:hypothetical protein